MALGLCQWKQYQEKCQWFKVLIRINGIYYDLKTQTWNKEISFNPKEWIDKAVTVNK